MTRCGFVSLVGAPNAGKSTLLNSILGQKVTIVSPKVQTTRRRIFGIHLQKDSQIIFIDTPGMFKPSTRLEKAMVGAAESSIFDCDIVCVLADVTKSLVAPKKILDKLGDVDFPVVVLLNKIDKVEKESLLIMAAELVEKYPFIAKVFMISALKNSGTNLLVDYLAGAVPEGVWMFPEDQITDLSDLALAAEITREKLFWCLQQEIPYGLHVEHETWDDSKKSGLKIHQRIVIDRENHKSIVVGKNGSMLKRVGEMARKEISEVLGRRVHLFLYVVVKEDWKEKREYYLSQGLEFK